MRNNFTQWVTGLILCFIAVTSCKCKKAALPKVEINTMFEQAPPLAEDITIKILKEPTDLGTVLVTMRFDKKVINSAYHAVMVSDEKLILRDDGEGGDAKAGDDIFSIILKEDIVQFHKSLVALQTANHRFLDTKKNIFKWVTRSAIPITEKLIKFNADSLLKDTVLKIPDLDILFPVTPDPVLNDRSLMITSLGVVEDTLRTFNPCTNTGNPNGAWTFGKLMADMANTAATGVNAEDFVKSWLDNWMADQTINGDVIPARPNIFLTIIHPWIVKSNPGIDPLSITVANWKTKTLQLKFAPFKLLAIVNRVDLRGNTGYSISNAGEGRFVFGLGKCAGRPPSFSLEKPMTIIFEYGVPKNTCATLKAYARQWINLKTMTPGTPEYNRALEAITNQFTAAGVGGSKPNGSSLNQIRTNEFIHNPWELREFNISKTSHLVISVPVKQEPAKIYNSKAFPSATIANQTILANYVNTNEAAILNNSYTIPETFSGVNFLGGKAHTQTAGHFWNAAATSGSSFITNDTARHIISINTCSGCHGGEGKTSVGNLINDPAGLVHQSFLHITPRPSGTKTTLSAFLTGDPTDPDGLFRVVDPAGRPSGSPTIWSFNDIARRNVDLQELATNTCIPKNKLLSLLQVLKFRPINMTH